MKLGQSELLICCFVSFVIGIAPAQVRVEKELLNKKIKGLQKEIGASYFLVVGDWGRNGQGHTQDVADWMGVAANQVDAKFVISTGDNFYCCGVASTEDYQWISSFENVFRSHSLQIPWYVTLGNHDYQGNVQAQIDYGKKNQRWKMPNRYFTKAMYDVRFVFIDTSPFIGSYYNQRENYPDLHQQDTARQLAWMDSVLTHAKERWKVVVGHHPIYSVGDHGSEPDLQRMVEGKLGKHHVNIYFAGHDHSLQSLQSKGNKLYHLISGGGSEHTPVTGASSMLRFAKGTTGFMIAAVHQQRFEIFFIDSSGKIIYTETLSI